MCYSKKAGSGSIKEKPTVIPTGEDPLQVTKQAQKVLKSSPPKTKSKPPAETVTETPFQVEASPKPVKKPREKKQVASKKSESEEAVQEVQHDTKNENVPQVSETESNNKFIAQENAVDSKNDVGDKSGSAADSVSKLASAGRHRVKWAHKAPINSEDLSPLFGNGDANTNSSHWIPYFHSATKDTPAEAPYLLTSELYPIFSLPTMVTVEMVKEDDFQSLKKTAANGGKIVLFNSHRQVLVKAGPAGKEEIPVLIGNLGVISSIAKHKTQGRCEVGILPIRRVYTQFRPELLKHTSTAIAPIKPLEYTDAEAADVNDVLMAAVPLLDPVYASSLFKVFGTIAPPVTLAEMALHRIAANVLNAIGKHDPNNIQGSLEVAFRSTSLIRKAELIHKAHDMASLTAELSYAIEEISEMRRIKGVDVQMEKLLRQQLGASLTDEPEMKILEAIKSLPQNIQTIATKEFDYLKTLDSSGGDYGLTYSYLEWLVNLPWDKHTKDNFDIKNAKAVLDKHHYGLEDVKTKILQLVANASRTSKVSSKPLLFVGPPGSGKTSFAKSIAEALGRKFINIAGLTEAADLRGFRRTYVGSMPGKALAEMRRVESNNPVIVFDEVDKLDDRRTHKPVTPALLELLSPDQNKTFFDQYLDMPFDCSKALFICTANSTDTISPPLLNRMHVIELRAYSEQEKRDIMQGYVLPQVIAETGLKNVTFEPSALKTLVQVYSKYEAGVRQLRRNIQRVLRQLAVKAVKSDLEAPHEYTHQVTNQELQILLGAPEDVSSDLIYNHPPPGVVNGLAKNMYGGSTLTIEAVVDSQKGIGGGKPRVDFTGNIMETMSESSTIAYTYSKAFLVKHFPKNRFFAINSLHVHVPFASIKKDGPSAGCALVCTYISMALNKPLPATLCMTGEITLTGRVTAVGGIREKVTAAVQNGMKTVLIPKQNKADFEAIPADLVAGITPHFVSTFKEAFQVAFDTSLAKKPTLKVKATGPSSRKTKSSPTAKPSKTPEQGPKIQLPDIEEDKIKKGPQPTLSPQL